VEADHGATWVDFDGDGDQDLALTGTAEGATHALMQNLLRPEVAFHSLKVRVLDADGRATLAGAEVRVYAAGTFDLLGTGLVDTGSGYDAQNDLPLHFGLPGADYAVLANTTLQSFTDSSVSAGCVSFPCEFYYLVVPLDAGGRWLASSYSSGIYLQQLNGHTSWGLPLRPYGPPDPDANWTVASYATRMQALGILYWQNTSQVWVPHPVQMPAGVYDARVAQAAGYQVTVPAIRLYAFQGW